MNRCLPALLLVAAILGAAPASRPAPKPAAPPDERAAQASLADAEKDLKRARADATAAFDASAAGRPLVADVQVRTKALADARTGGVKKERLDATKALSAARVALEKARAAATGGDPAVVAASEKVERAKAQSESAGRAAAEAAEAEKMRDPMNQAAAKGQILVGMTRDQVREAMRVTDKTTHGVESGGGEQGLDDKWLLNGDRPDEVDFHDGVVVKIHNRR